MSKGFQFRQFFVAHDRCAMKVGTDGVLLGATSPLPPPQEGEYRILDIGTGTGLVALMKAQWAASSETSSLWEVVGIDIDPAAVEQARENFAASPWAEHLHAHLASLQDYNPFPLGGEGAPKGQERGFHLIVSNPPYFVDSLKNPDAQRQAARHTDTLSYEELIRHSCRLLTEDGVLQLILPIEAEEEIIRLGREHGLYPTHILYIRTTTKKAPKRFIITFEREADRLVATRETLTLMGENGEPRSTEYAELCRDFYL